MADETRVLIKGADRGGIPLDVFGSLTGAIGVLYPNARMGPGEYGHGVTLVIGPEDRRNTVKGRKRAIAAKRQELDDAEPQANVIGWDGESLRTTPPAEAAEALLHYGLAFLEGTEGAVDNVEQRAMLPDGRGIVLTVQWLHGKSPAEQRVEAEAKIAAARGILEKLRGNGDEGCAEGVKGRCSLHDSVWSGDEFTGCDYLVAATRANVLDLQAALRD